ncbi:MAG: orotate phosphoribosyltransferase [bacterium]
MTESGALLNGHFVLSSGLHSEHYIQCARLLEAPERAEVVGRNLARLVEETVGSGVVKTVVNPALGGIIIGHEVARALGARCVFTERLAGQMTLRRGFSLRAGERVLVVEDVVTTGLSTNEVIRTVRAEGAEVVGVAAIVDRSAGIDFGVPYMSLVRADIANFSPTECPMCKAGVPPVKPGSRTKEKA